MRMTKATKAIRAELEAIRKRHGGVLDPKHVVHFAADEETALHGCFTWDDTKAAQEHRLWQARELIRTVVHMTHLHSEAVNMYVSLTGDRKAGGYRFIGDVLTAAKMRAMLLADALAEFERIQKTYHQLTELADVFSAIGDAKKRQAQAAALAAQWGDGQGQAGLGAVRLVTDRQAWNGVGRCGKACRDRAGAERHGVAGQGTAGCGRHGSDLTRSRIWGIMRVDKSDP